MVDIDECTVALEPVREPDHAAAAANPDPSSISADAWGPFEDAALAVVGRIQPSVPSEGRRAAVVHYVQRLIRRTVLRPYFSTAVCCCLNGSLDHRSSVANLLALAHGVMCFHRQIPKS